MLSSSRQVLHSSEARNDNIPHYFHAWRLHGQLRTREYITAHGYLGNKQPTAKPFYSQISQLDELLAIRHCNFIVGQAGAGKSSCWKVLKEARSRMDPSNKVKVRDTKSFVPALCSSRVLLSFVCPNTQKCSLEPGVHPRMLISTPRPCLRKSSTVTFLLPQENGRMDC